MKLIRDDETDERTYGTLMQDDGTVLCQTLELPWRSNRADVSCIPAGTYTAFRFNSPHIGYELFQLENVPQRQGIDIHIGNRMADTHGCILVGFVRGQLDGEDAILQSRVAFKQFMADMAGIDRFDLTVLDAETPQP